MTGDWLVAIAPVAGLAGNTLVTILAAHLSRGNIVRAMILGAVSGAIATVALIFHGRDGSSGEADAVVDAWCLGVVTYAALSIGLWAFVNLNLTSLRIRTLREIHRAGGAVPLADLLQLYSEDERLSRRLDRLGNARQMAFDDGRWRLISRQLLVVAWCVATLRRVVMPRTPLPEQPPAPPPRL